MFANIKAKRIAQKLNMGKGISVNEFRFMLKHWRLIHHYQRGH